MPIRRFLYPLKVRLSSYRGYETIYQNILKADKADPSAYLRDLLSYARAHVPYYHALPQDPAGFSHVPLLTKDLIREHAGDLKTDELERRKHWFRNSSGGSSGRPVTLIQDREFELWTMATEKYYYRHLMGIDYYRVPKVVLWGSENDIFRHETNFRIRLDNWLGAATLLNSFRMSASDMERHAGVINAIRPVLLRGYGGSLYQLALHIRDNNLKVHRPRAVCSSAETLRPFMRRVIEDVFGAKVYNFYGSREVGPMAGECSRGRMHVFAFNNRVEVLGGDAAPAPSGREGRIVVTSLHNYAMPLVRYEIGDLAIPAAGCDCGSALPVLESITGRSTDHFVTRDSALIHGEYFTHLFYFREWVREFHVLQTAYDAVDISYIPAGPLPERDREEIEGRIRLVMGNECRINWRRVEAIPRTPGGKLIFTRSLVFEEREQHRG